MAAMIAWAFMLGFSLAAIGLLLRFGKLPRFGVELALAAILIGVAGYVWQGEPSQAGVPVERKDKPMFVSVPQGVDPHTLTQTDLDYLCAMPLEIGEMPESGETITFRLGKYGPYIEAGAERRTVEEWTMGRTLTAAKAAEILSQPKGRPVRAAVVPLKEFGDLPDSAGPVRVMSGRFGPYVTDGTTNATLPKSILPADLTSEQAADLLATKRAAGPSVKKAPARRTAAKAATAKAAVKKAPAKKAPAKKKAA